MLSYILFKILYKYGGSQYFTKTEDTENVICVSKTSWSKLLTMKTFLYCMQKTCPSQEVQNTHPDLPWKTINHILQPSLVKLEQTPSIEDQNVANPKQDNAFSFPLEKTKSPPVSETRGE